MKGMLNDWAPESPTPAQLKEFFTQIECKRITKSRLQGFLREEDFLPADAIGRVSESPTPAQLKEFFAQIECGRITKSRLQKFLCKNLSDSVPIPLIYDLNEVREMIKKHWLYGEDITEKDLPTKRTGQKVKMKLFHFNKKMTSEEVVAEIKMAGYSPAQVHELLSYGAANPDEQIRYPIVGLGSIFPGYANPRIACLHGNGNIVSRDGTRYGLKLFYNNTIWSKECRFAAVRRYS